VLCGLEGSGKTLASVELQGFEENLEIESLIFNLKILKLV
jgi:hypothetical protein